MIPLLCLVFITLGSLLSVQSQDIQLDNGIEKIILSSIQNAIDSSLTLSSFLDFQHHSKKITSLNSFHLDYTTKSLFLVSDYINTGHLPDWDELSTDEWLDLVNCVEYLQMDKLIMHVLLSLSKRESDRVFLVSQLPWRLRLIWDQSLHLGPPYRSKDPLSLVLCIENIQDALERDQIIHQLLLSTKPSLNMDSLIPYFTKHTQELIQVKKELLMTHRFLPKNVLGSTLSIPWGITNRDEQKSLAKASHYYDHVILYGGDAVDLLLKFKKEFSKSCTMEISLHLVSEISLSDIYEALSTFKVVDLSLMDYDLRGKNLKTFLGMSDEQESSLHTRKPLITRLTSIFNRESNVFLYSSDIVPFPYLQKVKLRGCKLGSQEMRALATSGMLHNLQEVNLDQNRIKSDGVKILSRIQFKQLKQLSLVSNDIGDSGLNALLSSQFIYSLNSLDVSWNHLTDSGAKALLKFIKTPHIQLKSIRPCPRLILH